MRSAQLGARCVHDPTSTGLRVRCSPVRTTSLSRSGLLGRPTGAGGRVREAETVEDFVATAELAADLLEMTGEDREGMISSLRRRHELGQQGRTHMRTYLAYVDGELVGEAQGTETAIGTNLSGSSVLPHGRGRDGAALRPDHL